MCLKSHTLFHYHDGKSVALTQSQQTPTHIQYQLYESLTAGPQNTVPITPILMSYSIHIPLPIIACLPKQLPTYDLIVPLATRLNTPPEEWADCLWQEVRPHGHTDQLWHVLYTNTNITIVSDAAVHNNGTATCAWVIWAGHDLWEWWSYVLGIADEMYSGLAEAYRIATVLGFVAHYLNMYPLTLSHCHSIQIYCNNQGMIDCINNHHTVNPYPHEAIKDDYPVYKEI